MIEILRDFVGELGPINSIADLGMIFEYTFGAFVLFGVMFSIYALVGNIFSIFRR